MSSLPIDETQRSIIHPNFGGTLTVDSVCVALERLAC